jgi:hypothetical protein
MGADWFSKRLKGAAVSESRGGEQQEILERFQADVSERFASYGAPSAEHAISNVREATQQASYLVGISNQSDTAFTVVIAYVTSDNPDAQETQAALPPGGEVVAFALTSPGQCATLLAYVMGFFVDDQLVYISPEDAPEGGYWTPERVSQEFPEDQDPCVDVWVIG